jgi:cyclin D1/2/4
MSTRAPPAVAPSDPAASAAAEATRASLQRRVERATCDSRAHSVLVRRALDELRGALAAERRQAAFLPADLGARLADVAQMRACLVEGLVRSALAFELSVCTTALAVRYLDRFLGAGAYDVSKHQGWVYHLVANACQSIAVKLQESLRVDPDTLQRHFDVRFDKACVLKMESLVLRELGWSVNDVVAATHAPRLLYALGFDGDAHAELVTKTDLFLLSTLYDPNMCHVWAPSVLAAAAVALALSDQHGCDAAGVVKRVGEAFASDENGRRFVFGVKADGGDDKASRPTSSMALSANEEGLDVDSVMACVQALEAYRDALAGAAERRR